MGNRNFAQLYLYTVEGYSMQKIVDAGCAANTSEVRKTLENHGFPRGGVGTRAYSNEYKRTWQQQLSMSQEDAEDMLWGFVMSYRSGMDLGDYANNYGSGSNRPSRQGADGGGSGNYFQDHVRNLARGGGSKKMDVISVGLLALVLVSFFAARYDNLANTSGLVLAIVVSIGLAWLTRFLRVNGIAVTVITIVAYIVLFSISPLLLGAFGLGLAIAIGFGLAWAWGKFRK
jgi:hypothetical protein